MLTMKRLGSAPVVFNVIPSQTLDVTTETNFAFKLADVATADVDVLFEQYKIHGVQVMIRPNTQMIVTAANGVNMSRPTHYIVFDPDSNNVQTLSDIRQYANCKVFDATKPVSLFIKPRMIFNTVDANLAVTFSGNRGATWCDMGDKNVAHYGLRIQTNVTASGAPPPTGFTWKWTVEYRYYFSCRGIR